MGTASLTSRMARIPLRIRRLLSSGPPTLPRAGAAQKRDAQRRSMLNTLPEHAVCAEIGTWRGDFAAVILEHREPELLYLVDPWEHRPEGEYAHASYGGRMEGGQQALESMHQGVLQRFGPEIARGQVQVLRRRSTSAAAGFADESLDWVYIDGDHSYEGVKADLEAYFRTVKSGGALAGDDYGHVGSWFGDGVTRAVDEFAARCAGLEIIGTQFVLKKP
jgi:hypothetical protein